MFYFIRIQKVPKVSDKSAHIILRVSTTKVSRYKQKETYQQEETPPKGKYKVKQETYEHTGQT